MVSIKNYIMVILCLLTIVKTEDKKKLNKEMDFKVDGDKIIYSLNMEQTVDFELNNEYIFITFSKKQMECKDDDNCKFIKEKKEDGTEINKKCTYFKNETGSLVTIQFNFDKFNKEKNSSYEACYTEEENVVASFNLLNFFNLVKYANNFESDFKLKLDLDYDNEKSENNLIKSYKSFKFVIDPEYDEKKVLKNNEELNLTSTGDFELKETKLKVLIGLNIVNDNFITIIDKNLSEFENMWNNKDKKVDLKIKKSKDESIFNDIKLSNNDNNKKKLNFEHFEINNIIILNSGFYKNDYSVLINVSSENKEIKTVEFNLILKSSGGSALVVILIIIACLIAAAALCLIFLKIVKKKNVDEDDDDEYVKQE